MKNLYSLITLTAAGYLPLAAAQYFAPLSYNTTNHSLVMSSMNGMPPQDAGGNQSIYYNGNLTVSGTISGNFSGNVGGGGGSGGSGNYSGNFTGGGISGLLLGNTTVTPEAFGNTSLAPAPFNYITGNYLSTTASASTYAPLNSPTFTGNGQLSGNFLVGGYVSGTWNGTNFTESQVTNLSSDLGAKAPLASPALTGSPSVTGNLAVSGNSSALNFNGTNGFFTNITATGAFNVATFSPTNLTVTNLQVNGDFAYGAINATIVGNNTASLAVNGTFLANGKGNSMFVNSGNDTQQGTVGTGNVLTIWNSNPDQTSGVNFRNAAGLEIGSLFHYNAAFGSGNKYASRMGFTSSMPYDDNGDSLTPVAPGNVSTPRGIFIGQEAYYNGAWVNPFRLFFDENWQFHMELPGGTDWLSALTAGNTSNPFGLPGDINTQLFLNGNTAGDSSYVSITLEPAAAGAGGPQSVIGASTSTLNGLYNGFPANGTYFLNQLGAQGFAFITSSTSSTANFTWATGGLTTSSQKMQLTNAGNLTLGTLTPAAGALLTVAGDAAMSGNITLSGNVTDTSSAGAPQGMLVISSNASGMPFYAAHASSGRAFDMELPTLSGNAVALFISNTTQQQFISDADGSSINFIVGDTYQNDTLQVNGTNIAVTGNASVSGNITTAAGPPFAITGNNTTTLFITINGITRNITFAP